MKSYYFKVIKKSLDKIYLYGYISGDSYIRLGNPKYIQNGLTTIFPISYQEYSHPVVVPLNKVSSIKGRTVEGNKVETIDVIDVLSSEYVQDTKGY